jgi:type II secretory pathway component PulF
VPLYDYTALDLSGAIKKGSIEAQDQDEAQMSLEGSGLTVLELKGKSPLALFIGEKLTTFRVSRLEIIEVVKNLGTVLSAGIPILTAIEDSITTVGNKVIRKALQDIKEDLVGGLSFSDALKKQAHVFPDIVIRLAYIGENTGRLDVAMKDAAEHLQRVEDIASMIKRALMYPTFALISTGGALIFWLVYVLPKILTVMKEMQVKIPAVTRALMVVSNFMATGWYWILLFLVSCLATYKLLNRYQNIKYYFDLLKIKFPILKNIIYNKLLALFAEQMRILISAGIIIDRCFEITASAMGSEVFRRAIVDAKERLIQGEGIASSLKQHAVFPPIVIRMVDVGEKSGNLDAQFRFLSEYFFDRLESFNEKLGKTIEPILIAIVGGMFAIIAIGLLMPLYDLITKIK